MLLDQKTARVLARALGMLGSDFPGERDNAARLVARLAKEHGIDWNALLAVQTAAGGMFSGMDDVMAGFRDVFKDAPFHRHRPDVRERAAKAATGGRRTPGQRAFQERLKTTPVTTVVTIVSVDVRKTRFGGPMAAVNVEIAGLDLEAAFVAFDDVAKTLAALREGDAVEITTKPPRHPNLSAAIVAAQTYPRAA